VDGGAYDDRAVGMDRWHDGSGYEAYVGRWSRRVAERFVPWLEVRRGADWIDVGCGTGVLTRAVLELGDPRRVIGIDPSLAFLAAAKGTLRDSRVEFVEGLGGSLPLEAGSADAIVSGLVLNFIPDVPAALVDMRRVTRRDGVVAAYVWDYAGEMQLMRRFWDAAVELDPAAAAIEEGIRFPICQPDALEEAFRTAGLDEVAVTAIEVPTTFNDFDDYWKPFLRGVGPAPGYAMSLDDKQRERLRRLLDGTLPRDPDGTIPLIARAWAARGVV
jgi:SAM-dependent methyltransferase